MKLKKDYYRLPEAAESAKCSDDDLFALIEKGEVTGFVYLPTVSIEWARPDSETGEAERAGLTVESGYFELTVEDVRLLRHRGNVHVQSVIRRKKDETLYGYVAGKTSNDLVQDYMPLKLGDVWISNDDLSRLIDRDVGNWMREKREVEYAETEQIKIRNERWRREYVELSAKTPGISISEAARQISRTHFRDESKFETIRKVIRKRPR